MISLFDFKLLFPQSGQTIVFDYVTIAFIIIILINIIVNSIKGFVSSFVSLLSGLGSIIISFFLCRPIGGLLASNGFLSEKISNPIAGWINGFNDGMFNVEIPASNKEQFVEYINQNTKLPSFLLTKIDELIMADSSSGQTISQILANEIAMIVFCVIAFIVLFIIIKIVFFIIKKVTKNISNIPVIGPVNRILGGVFGLLEGVLSCFVVAAVFYLVFSINIVNEDVVLNISEIWFGGLDDPNKWSLSQAIYNVLSGIINK